MGIANIFASIQDAAMSISNKTLSSFSILETTAADDAHTVVASDGSLMTLIRIDGVKQVMGPTEFQNAIEVLSSRLATFLGTPGYAMQFWFCRDPDMAPEVVKRHTAPQRHVARSLGIDLADLFAERETHLPKYVVYEALYVALWTRVGVLSKQERQKAKASTKAPSGWPNMADAQNVFRAVKPLRDRHRSFRRNFVQNLREIDIRATEMTSAAAIQAIKASIEPTLIGADWMPTIPGTKTRIRMPEIRDQDMSHLLWPRLDEQIFQREAIRVNPRICDVGARSFAGVDMTIGPQELLPFSHLLQKMIEIDEFPWRASILLESGGMDFLSVKAFLASVFAWSNSENQAIKEAIKNLQISKTMDSATITRMRASFATWAPVGNLPLIEERAARLQRAVESWGNCLVSSTTGDPVAGMLSSALGIAPSSTAPAGAVPLPAAITMLPLDRDSSPWNRGSILFRTPDGRVWAFQPGSSLQDTFVDLIYATPGRGKSVYLNSANLALCLSMGATQGFGGAKLPRISIIDIGPSSSGLISLLKEALPPNRRHEAQYRRLKNDRAHAINPFDTQLGCRKPFPVEKAFLINFLTALGTPIAKDEPPNGIANLASFCIDELYEQFSDKSRNSTPRHYVAKLDHEVDKGIARHNIKIFPQMHWWDLVDSFFQVGDHHTAIMAQRHAVPTLQDLPQIVHTAAIKDIFGDAMADDEPLISVFQRMCLSALKDYEILSCPTQFDIGEARVIALDLDEVAPRSGKSGEKQTALMYMLARFAIAKDFYLNQDLLEYVDRGQAVIPPEYRQYHSGRIKRIRETPKRLVYDEFHRTSSSRPVRDQVLVDIREGRKWGVHVALASQLLSDFDPDMIKMASGIWIMGSNESSAKETQTVFGLSDTAYEIVRRDLNGPREGGAPFLAVLYLKDGKHEHLLWNTLGPIELWAFSTTAEDVALRNSLYDKLGATESRKRLAKRFSSGSAKREIERRIEVQIERGVSAEEAEIGIIEQLAKEITALAF